MRLLIWSHQFWYASLAEAVGLRLRYPRIDFLLEAFDLPLHELLVIVVNSFDALRRWHPVPRILPALV